MINSIVSRPFGLDKFGNLMYDKQSLVL